MYKRITVRQTNKGPFDVYVRNPEVSGNAQVILK